MQVSAMVEKLIPILMLCKAEKNCHRTFLVVWVRKGGTISDGKSYIVLDFFFFETK
jgi:hypothetical protein